MSNRQWQDIEDFQNAGCGDLWDEERHRPPYQFVRCATCGDEIDPAWGLADCGSCRYQNTLKEQRKKWRQQKRKKLSSEN